jgi:Secretion system C-terminal sorting domain
MKKYLFLLIFIVPFFASAQIPVYHPFSTTYQSWNYQYYDDFHLPTGLFTSYYLYGDTTISSVNYKKFFMQTAYKGALRENSKIIYFIPDTASTEYVLYNFNLTQGDTIFNPLGGNWANPDTVIVTSVDTVLTSTGYVRQLHLDSYVTWVEGVGSWAYLLSPTLYFPVSGNDLIKCMVGDSGYVYPGASSFCIASVSNEASLIKGISIYPNPFHDNSTVKILDFEYFNSDFKIYNVFGKLLKQYSILDMQTTINRDNLSNGLYFYRVTNKRGQTECGKFIVE